MSTDCSEEAKQYGSGSVQKTMAFDNDQQPALLPFPDNISAITPPTSLSPSQ